MIAVDVSSYLLRYSIWSCFLSNKGFARFVLVLAMPTPLADILTVSNIFTNQ